MVDEEDGEVSMKP